MTRLNIDEHVVVLRESKTGKSKHSPLRDLVEALEGAPLRQLPGPDGRVDQLCSEVSSLKERISALGNGGPTSDPRTDDVIVRLQAIEGITAELAERVIFIENAIKSLVIRALNEAEA